MKKLILTILLMLSLPNMCYAHFPNTPLLTNFDEADKTPPTGFADAVGLGVDRLSVDTNECKAESTGTLGVGQGYWTTSYNANQEAWIEIDLRGGYGHVVYLGSRVTSIPGFTPDGYSLRLTFDSDGTDPYLIFRVDNGVFTEIGNSISVTSMDNGDYIGVLIKGTTIFVLSNSTGSWIVIDSCVDATYTSAGYLLLMTSDVNVDMDNFGGGNFRQKTLISKLIEEAVENFLKEKEAYAEYPDTWFECPYEVSREDVIFNNPIRRCSVLEYADDIRKEGKFEYAEVGGDRCIVKVQASDEILDKIQGCERLKDKKDAESKWTPRTAISHFNKTLDKYEFTDEAKSTKSIEDIR